MFTEDDHEHKYHASTPSSPVEMKVGIVEDQRKFREYLAALIDVSEGFRCTRSFPSMEEALDRIMPGVDMPDVVLVDIGLPGMDGLEGIRILKERFPKLILLMHTVYDRNERITRRRTSFQT